MTRKLLGVAIPVLGLLLAACGGGAAPASSAAASVKASTGAAASASKPAASASSAASGPIKIGLIQPLTGIYANQGKDHSDGFQLYLDSVGDSVDGRKVQLIVEDDQGQPDVGLLKAKKLVENDKVQILAGGTVTPECYALAPYAKQVQVPFVNTGNCIGVDLTLNPKYASPYLYRVSVPVTASVDTLADWAYNNGYKKGAILVSDYVAGIQIGDGFSSAFIQRGGSIVQENYAPQGTA
ncbi:MAG: ABC transporter substrate-binding protein, partial [Chloroflexota bacterium]|nr:ABC transporter substrate-binding protein [Chloroflexota bacterium]